MASDIIRAFAFDERVVIAIVECGGVNGSSTTRVSSCVPLLRIGLNPPLCKYWIQSFRCTINCKESISHWHRQKGFFASATASIGVKGWWGPLLPLPTWFRVQTHPTWTPWWVWQLLSQRLQQKNLNYGDGYSSRETLRVEQASWKPQNCPRQRN